MQQLSGCHHCFAVDLPGMGETPFAPYSAGYLDRLAKQIDLLRIKNNIKKWHVVGHDAGSALAVHYAARFPRQVACVALLSPAIFPDLKPFFLLNTLRKPLVGEVLAPLVHLLFWRIAMRRAIAGESNGKALRGFYEPFSGFTGAWQLMRLVRWGTPKDMLGEIPAKLAMLSAPALIFHGSRDVLPAAFAERAASLIPHSRLVHLDAGHFLPLDQPKEVAAHLRSFFAENRTNTDRPLRHRKLRKPGATARTLNAETLILTANRELHLAV